MWVKECLPGFLFNIKLLRWGIKVSESLDHTHGLFSFMVLEVLLCQLVCLLQELVIFSLPADKPGCCQIALFWHQQ